MLTCPHVGIAVETRDEFGAAASGVLPLLPLPAQSRLYVSGLPAAHARPTPRAAFLPRLRGALRRCRHAAWTGRGAEGMDGRAEQAQGDPTRKPASRTAHAARAAQNIDSVTRSGIPNLVTKIICFHPEKVYRPRVNVPSPPYLLASNFARQRKLCHGQSWSAVSNRTLCLLRQDPSVRPKLSQVQ